MLAVILEIVSSPTPPPIQIPPRQYPQPPRKQKVGIIGYVAIAIPILILVFIVTNLIEGSTPEGRANREARNAKAEVERVATEKMIKAKENEAKKVSPEVQRILDRQDAVLRIQPKIYDATTDEHGFLRINGSIKNNSAFTLRYWELQINFLDNAGAIVDSKMVNGSTLVLPGASKKWDTILSSSPDYKEYSAAMTRAITAD
jgi:ectoine hydroxylase-related dioxygenase (phytanoyl-CoA dioxygenase family)